MGCHLGLRLGTGQWLLQCNYGWHLENKNHGGPTHLLNTPPSREALRHSGGERRLCTSATVTLYFDVELRRDRRPGTEQNTSFPFTTPPNRPSLLRGMAEMLLFLDKDTGPAKREHGHGYRTSI